MKEGPMSQAVELYKKDGSPAGVFYCSECRVVFPDQLQAENCHGERLCACGKKIEMRYHKSCSDCEYKQDRERLAAKELERFEKAKKITPAEYTGEWVFDADQYYASIEEALDRYLEGQEPEYVWACQNAGLPRASSDGIIEHLLDNAWEDADASDLNGVDELNAAIEAFNKANASIAVYLPDYTTAILVASKAASGSAAA